MPWMTGYRSEEMTSRLKSSLWFEKEVKTANGMDSCVTNPGLKLDPSARNTVLESWFEEESSAA